MLSSYLLAKRVSEATVDPETGVPACSIADLCEPLPAAEATGAVG